MLSLALAAAVVTGCGATQVGTPGPAEVKAPTPAVGATGAGTATTASTTPSATLATPEDAVKAYVAGLAAGDVDAILATGAIEEVGSAFRFDAYVDRLKAFVPVGGQGPAGQPFYGDANRIELEGRLVSQARMLAYSILSTDVTGPDVVPNVDAAWAKAFAKQVDVANLAGLTVDGVGTPKPSTASTPKYLEVMQASAATWGADEQVERVALVSLGGKAWITGFTLLRYGDTWRVKDQGSALADTDPSGAAMPTTPEDFAALIAG